MGEEFENMLALAFQILTEGPEQVLVCRTADGVIHSASLLRITEGDHREEDAFLTELKDQTVTHIIALWDSACIDLPSLHFRQQLRMLCPGSENALVLLQTGSGQMPIPLNMLP